MAGIAAAVVEPEPPPDPGEALHNTLVTGFRELNMNPASTTEPTWIQQLHQKCRTPAVRTGHQHPAWLQKAYDGAKAALSKQEQVKTAPPESDVQLPPTAHDGEPSQQISTAATLEVTALQNLSATIGSDFPTDTLEAPRAVTYKKRPRRRAPRPKPLTETQISAILEDVAEHMDQVQQQITADALDQKRTRPAKRHVTVEELVMLPPDQCQRILEATARRRLIDAEIQAGQLLRQAAADRYEKLTRRDAIQRSRSPSPPPSHLHSPKLSKAIKDRRTTQAAEQTLQAQQRIDERALHEAARDRTIAERNEQDNAQGLLTGRTILPPIDIMNAKDWAEDRDRTADMHQQSEDEYRTTGQLRAWWDKRSDTTRQRYSQDELTQVHNRPAHRQPTTVDSTDSRIETEPTIETPDRPTPESTADVLEVLNDNDSAPSTRSIQSHRRRPLNVESIKDSVQLHRHKEQQPHSSTIKMEVAPLPATPADAMDQEPEEHSNHRRDSESTISTHDSHFDLDSQHRTARTAYPDHEWASHCSYTDAGTDSETDDSTMSRTLSEADTPCRPLIYVAATNLPKDTENSPYSYYGGMPTSEQFRDVDIQEAETSVTGRELEPTMQRQTGQHFQQTPAWRPLTGRDRGATERKPDIRAPDATEERGPGTQEAQRNLDQTVERVRVYSQICGGTGTIDDTSSEPAATPSVLLCSTTIATPEAEHHIDIRAPDAIEEVPKIANANDHLRFIKVSIQACGITRPRPVIDLPMMLDGGATVNVISPALVKYLNCQIIPIEALSVEEVGTHTTVVMGRTNIVTRIPGVQITEKKGHRMLGDHSDVVLNLVAYVMDHCALPLILGSLTQQKWNFITHPVQQETIMEVPYMQEQMLLRHVPWTTATEQLHNLRQLMTTGRRTQPRMVALTCSIQATAPLQEVPPTKAEAPPPLSVPTSTPTDKPTANIECTAPVTPTAILKRGPGRPRKHPLIPGSEQATTAKKVVVPPPPLPPTQLADMHWREDRLDYEDDERIIKEFHLNPEDDLNGMTEYEPDPSIPAETDPRRPPLFPPDLWDKVHRDAKETTLQRWNQLTEPRLTAILADLKANLRICTDRPKQRPYCEANALAYITAFGHPIEEQPRRVKGYAFRIQTTHENPIINKKTPRFDPLQHIFLRLKTQELIRKQYNEPTCSPYRALPMLVKYTERVKEFMDKHGDNAATAMEDPMYEALVLAFYRFTIDYRLLNEATIPDQHPLPRTADCIEQFRGCSHFSCYDIKDAFWTVLVHIADRHKTAYATHNSLLQWMVLPQGCKNGAVAWARIIQETFRDAPEKSTTYFQDDLFAHTPTLPELLAAEREIYQRLIDRDMVVKSTKSMINYPRMKCLGHIIVAGGYRTADPKFAEALTQWDEKLVSRTEIDQFIGIVGYNRDYIPQVAKILAPLHDLRVTDRITEDWSDAIHGECIRKLKMFLTSPPLLRLPDPLRRYRIHVDTCTNHGRGVGAVLLQEHEVRNQHGAMVRRWFPVAYYSRLLKDNERQKSATEAEAMGMHEAIMRWSHYIQNGYPFEVVVDHEALVFLITAAATEGNKRILHYILDLQGYNFSVTYKRGKTHLDADAVSRLFGFNERPTDIDQLPEPTTTSFEEVTPLDFFNMKKRAEAVKYHRPALEASIRQHLRQFIPDPGPEPATNSEPTPHTLDIPLSVIRGMLLDTEYLEREPVNPTGTGTGGTPDEPSILQLYLTTHAEEEDIGDIGNVIDDEYRIDPENDYYRFRGSAEESIKMMSTITLPTVPLSQPPTLYQYQVSDIPPFKPTIQNSPPQPYVCLYTTEPDQIDTDSEEDSPANDAQKRTQEHWDPTHRYQYNLATGQLRSERMETVQLQQMDIYNPTLTLPSLPVLAPIVDTETVLAFTMTRASARDASKSWNSLLPRSRRIPSEDQPVRTTTRRQPLRAGAKTPNPTESQAIQAQEPAAAQRNKNRPRRIIEQEFGKLSVRTTDSHTDQISDKNPQRRRPINMQLHDIDTDAEPTKRTTDILTWESDPETGTKEPIATLPIDEQPPEYETDGQLQPILAPIASTDATAAMPMAAQPTIIRRNPAPRTLRWKAPKPPKAPKQPRVPRVRTPIARRPQPMIPLHAGDEDISDIDDQDGPARWETHRQLNDGRILAEAHDYLIGAHFQHPITKRIYEVFNVFWHEPTQQLAAYRRASDGLPPDQDDTRAFALQGPDGIITLVETYERQAGDPASTVRWPTNELEMLELQRQDPQLSTILDELGELRSHNQEPDPRITRRYHNQQVHYAQRVANYQQFHGLPPDAEQPRMDEHIAYYSALRCTRTSTQTTEPVPKVALPASLIPLLLRFYHEGMGHPGIERVFHTVVATYWWPGIHKDCTNHVYQCQGCQRRKADNQGQVGIPLRRRDVFVEPWSSIHLDLITSLPKTIRGHQHILVVKCASTDDVEIIPLRFRNKREVTQAYYDHVICRHGAPKFLITDRGTENLNDMMRAVNLLFEIHHQPTAAYNPRSNGKVENVNRTIKDMLSMFADTHQTNWDVVLPILSHCYRTTINPLTGYSPFYLNHAREARMPSEDWMTDFVAQQGAHLDEWIVHLQEVMTEAWVSAARQRMKEQQQRDIEDSEKARLLSKSSDPSAKPDPTAPDVRHSKPRQFKLYSPGDKFYLRSIPLRFYVLKKKDDQHKLAMKLQARYSGPHEVIEVRNPLVYRCNINGKIRHVHITRMKRAMQALTVDRTLRPLLLARPKQIHFRDRALHRRPDVTNPNQDEAVYRDQRLETMSLSVLVTTGQDYSWD